LNYGLFALLGWSWVNFSPLTESLGDYGYDVDVKRTVYVGGYGYVLREPLFTFLMASRLLEARGSGNGYEVLLGHDVARAGVGYGIWRSRLSERNLHLYPFVGFGYGRLAVRFRYVGDDDYDGFLSSPGRDGVMDRSSYVLTAGLGALFDFGFTVGFVVGYDYPVHEGRWYHGGDVLDGGPDVSPYGPYAALMIGYATDWEE